MWTLVDPSFHCGFSACICVRHIGHVFSRSNQTDTQLSQNICCKEKKSQLLIEIQLTLVISNSMGPCKKFESTVVRLKRSYENTGSVVCLTTKGRQLERNFEELLLSRTTVDSNFVHVATVVVIIVKTSSAWRGE